MRFATGLKRGLAHPLSQVVLTALLASSIWHLASSATSAQTMDRIQRGCGGLGGDLVRVLTDFDGSVRIKLCTGGSVYICNSAGVCTAINPGGPTGSGTAGTIPLWTAATVLGNSILTQTGTSAVTLGAGAFNYTQVAAPSVSAANFGKVYFDSTSKLLNGSFNGGAYFPFARTSVTNNTLAMGAANGMMVDSFASQSGNNFTVTGNAGGSILSFQTSGGNLRLQLDGTGNTLTGRLNNVNFLNLEGNTNVATIGMAGGVALGKFDATNQVITLGDVTGAGGNTRVEISDASSTINLRASATAQIDLNGSNISMGDVTGSGNTTTFNINDSSQTYVLNQLINCVTIGTDGSGTLTCTVSDVGLKQNLAPFTRGLLELMKLRPSFWNFEKGRYYHEGRRYAGLLAQDVQAAIPEAVDTTGDGHAQINPATMQATMVNAIQELKKLIDAQNARIAQLEKQLASKK